MKIRKAYRCSFYLLLIMNILNFFFLTIGKSNADIIDGNTFFTSALFNNFPLGAVALGGTGLGDIHYASAIMYFPCLIIDIVLLLILYTSEHSQISKEPFSLYVSVATLGIVLHVFYFMCCAQHNYKSYLGLLFDGYVGNLIWVLVYIYIILISLKLFDKPMDKEVNINMSLIIRLVLSFELILSFFYFSNMREYIYYSDINAVGKNYSIYFLTNNRMCFDIKVGEELYKGQGYLYIVLITYMLSIGFGCIKNKILDIIKIVMPCLSIILLLIGVIVCYNSPLVAFASNRSVNFFEFASSQFVIIILFNGLLSILSVFEFLQNKELVQKAIQ